MHVHVFCERGEAKFWLSPNIDLARNFGNVCSTNPGSKSDY